MLTGSIQFVGGRQENKTFSFTKIEAISPDGKYWEVKLSSYGGKVVKEVRIPNRKAQIGKPLLIMRDALNAAFPLEHEPSDIEAVVLDEIKVKLHKRGFGKNAKFDLKKWADLHWTLMFESQRIDGHHLDEVMAKFRCWALTPPEVDA